MQHTAAGVQWSMHSELLAANYLQPAAARSSTKRVSCCTSSSVSRAANVHLPCAEHRGTVAPGDPELFLYVLCMLRAAQCDSSMCESDGL